MCASRLDPFSVVTGLIDWLPEKIISYSGIEVNEYFQIIQHFRYILVHLQHDNTHVKL